MSDRLVRHGLSVLVHHQLVFWYTLDNRLTTYEANPETAYLLVRSGKFVRIVEDRLGSFASDIISNLLFLGHAQVGDLVQAYGAVSGSSITKSPGSCDTSCKPLANGSTPMANGVGHDDTIVNSIYSTLRELLSLGLVSEVNQSHFRSDADNRIEAEKVVPPIEHYKAKSKRDNEAQWEASVNRKLKEWKHGEDDEILEIDGVMKGRKRQRDDQEDCKTEKRQRLQTATTQHANGAVGATYRTVTGEWGNLNVRRQIDLSGIIDTYIQKQNTILRINQNKFAVIMRNSHLTRVARQSTCRSTSEVYSEALRALEPSVRKCKGKTGIISELEQDRDLTSLPQVSTEELASVITDTEELANAFCSVDPSASHLTHDDHPKKRRKKEFHNEDEAIVNGDASSDEDEDEHDSYSDDSAISVDSGGDISEADYDPSPNWNIFVDSKNHTIRQHLLLLARHPYGFLHRFSQTHMLPERWTVDFPTLIKNIIHHTLIETITARHGVLSRRIAEVLHEKGKVGEKELTAVTCIGQKTMRSYLAKLHRTGMIHLQEIPRDNSRTPARTMYLWYLDGEKSKAKLMEELYKNMTRCLQRATVEAEKIKDTLEKADRSDIKGNEEKFLTIQEREALEKWRITEDKILGGVERLDDLLAIISDF